MESEHSLAAQANPFDVFPFNIEVEITPQCSMFLMWFLLKPQPLSGMYTVHCIPIFFPSALDFLCKLLKLFSI